MELEPVMFYISDLLQSPRVKHERDMDQSVRAIPTLKQEGDQRLPVWWIRIKLRLVPSVVVSGPRNKCCRTKQRPHQTGKGPRGQAPSNPLYQLAEIVGTGD